MRLVLLTAFLFLAACSPMPGPYDSGYNRVCVPGSTERCGCFPSSGEGVETCIASGERWGACVCAADAGPVDSGARTDCRSCRSDTECPGSFCGQRLCDGLKACAPTGGMDACLTIEGVPCPAVSQYRRCVDDAQCGPAGLCVQVYPGAVETVCSRACDVHADCAPVPSGGGGIPYCSSTMHQCLLGCEVAGPCTFDLTCTRNIRGVYAYCL